jgi:hypothetical protein
MKWGVRKTYNNIKKGISNWNKNRYNRQLKRMNNQITKYKKKTEVEKARKEYEDLKLYNKSYKTREREQTKIEKKSKAGLGKRFVSTTLKEVIRPAAINAGRDYMTKVFSNALTNFAESRKKKTPKSPIDIRLDEMKLKTSQMNIENNYLDALNKNKSLKNGDQKGDKDKRKLNNKVSTISGGSFTGEKATLNALTNLTKKKKK